MKRFLTTDDRARIAKGLLMYVKSLELHWLNTPLHEDPEYLEVEIHEVHWLAAKLGLNAYHGWDIPMSMPDNPNPNTTDKLQSNN